MPRRAKKNTTTDGSEDMDLKDLFSLFKKLKRNVEKKAKERKEELKRKAAADSRREVERKLTQASRVRVQRLESIRDEVRGIIQHLMQIESELSENDKIKTKTVSFEKRIRKEASEATKHVQQKWDSRFGENTKARYHEEVQKRIHHFLRDLHDSIMGCKTGLETLRSELRRGVRRLGDVK